MEEPTLKEVDEYFKNAKIVNSAYGNGKNINITKNVLTPIHFFVGCYWIDIGGGFTDSVSLWDDIHGYAKIVESK